MSEFWPWMPIVTAAQAFLTWRRVLGYLRYFQQEGYEHLRFLRWVNVRSLTDPAFWLAIVAAFLFLWAPTSALVLFVAGAVILGAGQPDPRRSGKVLLKLTWRATRVLTVAMVFAFSAWIIVTSLYGEAGLRAPLIAAAVLLAFMPLVLVAANLSLALYERAVQRGYEAEAVARVAEVHPFIVGITGSYGKSSTKAMLATTAKTASGTAINNPFQAIGCQYSAQPNTAGSIDGRSELIRLARPSIIFNSG